MTSLLKRRALALILALPLVLGLAAAHAQDIAKAQHPSGRLSAVPAELSVPLGAGEMTDA